MRVIVLNDWLCDTSTWDPVRPFLDATQFTFVFADLRGYGRSIRLPGTFSLLESAQDVIRLSDSFGWAHLAIVGHSMSSLVALHLAQKHSDRIQRTIAVCPPPPRGFQADSDTFSGLRALALASDDERARQLAPQFGNRLAPGWLGYKLLRWRSTADPQAVAEYTAVFARDGLPDPAARISVPLLAITGEQDAPPMRAAAVERSLQPICDSLTIKALADSGHYPMQEAPPLTAALVQQFLLSCG